MAVTTFDYVPSYVKEFLYSYRNNNASSKTVSEYYLDLRTFFRYVYLNYYKKIDIYKKDPETSDLFDSTDTSSLSIEDFSKIILSEDSTSVFSEYFYYCIEFRGDAVASRSRKTSSIRSFFKFLCAHHQYKNYFPTNPTEYLKQPKKNKRLPVYLTENEAIKLLETIDGNYKARNYAIITLFLNCGLRLSELVNINLNDINDNQLTVIGKGNKARMIYLNSACRSAIDEYLKVRPVEGVKDPDRKALFISRNNKRISNRMVQQLVSDFMDKAGLDTSVYSTHKLRHTAATLMYQNGVDVRALQEVLGHESLSTTQIYTHISSKQVEKAVNSNPLANIEAPSSKINRNDDPEEKND